jgi:hypothetical protein
MEFDDGTLSVMELHRGCKEDCKKLASMIPGVCNSTGKRAVQSFLGMPTEEEFDAAMALEATGDE